MVSLLEGPLKRTIARVFKGKLKTGTIRQIPSTGTLDDYGDQTPDTPIDAKFTGIRENFDASWARSAGIPDTDVKILILLGSIVPSTVFPAQDNLVFIEAQWHKIRRVLNIDPAGASMEVQVYVVTVEAA